MLPVPSCRFQDAPQPQKKLHSRASSSASLQDLNQNLPKRHKFKETNEKVATPQTQAELEAVALAAVGHLQYGQPVQGGPPVVDPIVYPLLVSAAEHDRDIAGLLQTYPLSFDFAAVAEGNPDQGQPELPTLLENYSADSHPVVQDDGLPQFLIPEFQVRVNRKIAPGTVVALPGARTLVDGSLRLRIHYLLEDEPAETANHCPRCQQAIVRLNSTGGFVFNCVPHHRTGRLRRGEVRQVSLAWQSWDASQLSQYTAPRLPLVARRSKPKKGLVPTFCDPE